MKSNEQVKRKKKSVMSMPGLDNLDPPSGKDHSPRKKKRDMAVSPHTKTPGSPRSSEKHKALPQSEEFGSSMKKIKMEKSECMSMDTDLLSSKGKKKIRA